MTQRPTTSRPRFSRGALDRLRDVLARHIANGAAPGLVALIARGSDEHVLTIGTTAPNGDRPLRRDAIFRISSMTKPVIAAAAMSLIDDGALTLDEPIDRLLPELAGRRVLRSLDGSLDDTVPAHRPITMRDLLTFTFGFGLVIAPPGTYPIQSAMEELSLAQGIPSPAIFPPPDEWLRRLGTLPLMYQPGERWLYNTGSDVLGVLIARAADQPLPDVLRDRLFTPLGMNDTAFFVPADARDRFAPEYWTDPVTGAVEVYDPAAGGQWSVPPAFPSGAAGLVSTIDDYGAFSRLLLNGGLHGDTRVLSASSVALMTSNQLTPAQQAAGGPILPAGSGWGSGLSVFTRQGSDGQPVGTFGWDGGLGTSWSADPATGLTAMLFTHRAWEGADGSPLFHDFRREVSRLAG